MSDVPISNKKLRCCICNWYATTRGALQWHGFSAHRDAGRAYRGRRAQVDGRRPAPPVSALPTSPGAVRADAAATGGKEAVSAHVEETATNGGVDGAPAKAPPVNNGETCRQEEGADDADGATADDGNEGGMGVKDRNAELYCRLQALIVLAAGNDDCAQPPLKQRKTSTEASTASTFDYTNIGNYIQKLYEEMKDWQRSEPLVSPRKRARPGQFETYRLQALQRFVLRTGRAGLSLREQEDLFDLLDIWDGTRPGMLIDDGHDRKLRKTFNSAYAFQCALRDDLDAAVVGAGWKTCVLEEGGEKYVAIFRSALDALLEQLRSGKTVRFWSGVDGPAEPTHMREKPMDGDAFRKNEEEIVRGNPTKPGAFCMGLHVYSDSSLVSWSGAHKLYPVRVRLVNVVSGKTEWVTVAYVPVVRKLSEPGAGDKARDRRCGVLQRVLFLAFQSAMKASHDGLELHEEWNGVRLWAFPRVLLYVCDQPEERAVLCLKPGMCEKPCSLCDVRLADSGAPTAVRSKDRVVVRTLARQAEANALKDRGTDRSRRLHLESLESLHSHVPAMAGFAGLSTPPHTLYKMVGFDVLHVLDLGVTRMLVHRLVRIFPYICAGHYPRMGSFAATYRAANKRLQYMGRRSKARKLAPGYVVGEGELQATFTGAQQREGVYALPFIVAGLLGLGKRKPNRSGKSPADLSAEHAARMSNDDGQLFPLGLFNDDASRCASAVEGARAERCDSDNEEDGINLAKNFQFDWVAYRAAFNQTPVEVAVTAMFAEYATLYAALCRQVGSSSAPPLTLSEAEALGAKATRFVNLFATPLLGVLNTTKIHRLLRHVLDAIKWHGNLSNGSTAGNEAQHKDDKPYYMRTNRGFDTFTGQIVRHAQGARIILAAHRQADEDRAARFDVVPGNRDGGGEEGAEFDSDRELDALLGDSLSIGDEEGGAADGDAEGARPRGHMEQQTVEELSWRPGLSRCATLLRKRSQARLGVLSCHRFTARLDDGTELPQLLRASPSFHNKPWYDTVAYQEPGDGDAAVAYGEVRALVRVDGSDLAIICKMVEVTGVPGCPLVQRGCKRLRWALTSDCADVELCVVPVEYVKRLLHVVPDFGTLLQVVGAEVAPPPPTAPVRVLGGMHYFANDFFPWG